MVNHENFVFEKEPKELLLKNRLSFIMVILCVAPVASRGFLLLGSVYVYLDV